MNDTIKAVGIAATLLVSPAADAEAWNYYYNEPLDVERTFRSQACVGGDMLSIKASVKVGNTYPSFANGALNSARFELQSAWESAVAYSDPQYEFETKAYDIEANLSDQFSTYVEIDPQKNFSVSRGACNHYYMPPPHHHHHRRHNGWNFGLPFPY